MIIHCFSSEDFRPKRLVIWKLGDGAGNWSEIDDKKKVPKKGPARAQRQNVSPEQVGKYLTRSRKKTYEIKGQLAEGVRTELSTDKAKKTMSSFSTRGAYNPRDWAAWNEAYAEKMYPGKDRAEVQKRIKAMQRVVFSELGLAGDPSAAIDGKIGPYTLAAMAAFAGNDSAIAHLPTRNKALARAIDMVPGKEVLKGAKKLDDGTYEHMTGDKPTYFKYVPNSDGSGGKWMWASAWQKRDNKWVETGTNPYDDKKTYAKANAISEKLKVGAKASAKLAKANEAKKIRETVEAAGKLDTKFKWYLVKSEKSPTGYKLVPWKPLAATSPIDIARDNKAALNKQKAGETITFNIDGEKVTMKKHASGSYSVEGVKGKMDLADAYKAAIKAAIRKRKGKKPKPVPMPKKVQKAVPLAPPDRPDLAFMDWDPASSAKPKSKAPKAPKAAPKPVSKTPKNKRERLRLMLPGASKAVIDQLNEKKDIPEYPTKKAVAKALNNIMIKTDEYAAAEKEIDKYKPPAAPKKTAKKGPTKREQLKNLLPKTDAKTFSKILAKVPKNPTRDDVKSALNNIEIKGSKIKAVNKELDA